MSWQRDELRKNYKNEQFNKVFGMNICESVCDRQSREIVRFCRSHYVAILQFSFFSSVKMHEYLDARRLMQKGESISE